ncbi:putative immunoglobulin-blocking virulence protein [Mycoplasmopsis pulmonis]|uniref:putative immunoglobulin-blocking virulence protein n=1 Tax=Mycoplasmopsis pulmonis TaxID=2107 RepID=UPI0003096693|nr:putative immunoglobulin-blocking virulence protein [Mycoplasmopsis pulmonis]
MSQFKHSEVLYEEQTPIKLIPKNNLDYSEANISNTDFNLPEIPKPLPKPEPPKPPQEDPIIKIPPQPEPEKPKEEPKPEPKPEPEKPKEEPKPAPPPVVIPAPAPKPIPKPVQPKPIPAPAPAPKLSPKPSVPERPIQGDDQEGKIVDRIILGFDNKPIKGKFRNPRKRQTFQSDIDKEIANRNPYVNDLGKLVSIEVTDELRKDNIKNSLSITNRLLPQVFDQLSGDDAYKNIKRSNLLQNLIYRFHRLLNSPNVVNFLTEKGKQEYPQIQKDFIENPKKLSEEEKRNLRYARLINHLDLSKFNKLSAQSEKFLAEGLTTDPNNIYFNENGEIESHSFSPLINTGQQQYARDNSTKRTFGYNSYYGRGGADIIDGKYPGWKNDDITDLEEYKKHGASKADGITVSKLTKIEKTDQGINEGIVVTIDVSNQKGYEKAKAFIEALVKEKKEITAYRILHIGKKDANQRFGDILKVLPKKLKQLDLFFETKNTSALLELEDKEIDELGMFTKGYPNNDSWNFNPFALKKVAWVNTIDYNASWNDGDLPYSRIVFDTISFDQKDKDLNRINDGLRMAYFVRNNEKIFQGGFGPGLDPDHKESGNSYPTRLDLSRIESIKSLRGLIFRDEKKPQNGERKIKNLKLYNNSLEFEIDTEELNEANFDVFSFSLGPPRTKIEFSNGGITRFLKVVFKNGTPLNSTGFSNLNRLLDLASDNFGDREIIVNPGETALHNQLKGIEKRIKIQEKNDASINFL